MNSTVRKFIDHLRYYGEFAIWALLFLLPTLVWVFKSGQANSGVVWFLFGPLFLASAGIAFRILDFLLDRKKLDFGKHEIGEKVVAAVWAFLTFLWFLVGILGP